MFVEAFSVELVVLVPSRMLVETVQNYQSLLVKRSCEDLEVDVPGFIPETSGVFLALDDEAGGVYMLLSLEFVRSGLEEKC